jgi:hypothetical protein
MLGCCLLAAAASMACAQATQKPGLYEMTSQMSWQKSPMPAGMTMPAGIPNPFAPKPFTTQVCLTQALIDRYGGPVPQAQGRGQQSCKMTNIKVAGNTMTGTLVCTGHLQGQGSVESSWSGNTSRGKLHFTGSMQGGPSGEGGMPVEWTVDSTSTYKGPDCGSVKPIEIPESK